MIFSLSSCCMFCQVMTVSRFELSNTARLFMLIFWRDVSEVRHAAQRLLPGIFRPLPSCFLSLPRYTNAHTNWGSSILFVVSTVRLVRELHFKPKKKREKICVCGGPSWICCVYGVYSHICSATVGFVWSCRPKWHHAALLLPSSWTQIRKVNDVIHSPLFFPFLWPVCCGASNQTNVQRLGQLNCVQAARFVLGSSGLSQAKWKLAPLHCHHTQVKKDVNPFFFLLKISFQTP